MSVEAQAWAWRQTLPLKPKFVLVTLADQTDERTGRVCYGKTDLAFLAKKCAMPVRSLSRCIAALIRNGYMLRESGKEKGRPSIYWLCLARPPAEHEDEFSWSAVFEGDPQDVDEGSATMADPLADAEPVDEAENGLPGRPIGGRHESIEEPKNHCARARAKPTTGFDRRAQALEIENLTIQQAAERTGAQVFVIENTKAWNAWCLWRKRKQQVGSMPTCAGQGEFAGRRGWWMPSLFPPKDDPTGPPPPTITKDDDEFVSKQQGLG